jgi:DNA-binding XRE family transcriptional regulator
MSQLHEILLEAVETSGMSKTTFASAVGLSRTSLFHILRGTSLPKRGTLDNFIKVLKLEEPVAGEWIHLLETARLNTIESSRKEVRSARQLFKSSTFSALQKEGECELDSSGLPDFWLRIHSIRIPVIAEMKIVDPYNLLGRIQMLRAQQGELKNNRWQTWVCVSEMEPAYQNYIADFQPFQIQVDTLDNLLSSIPEAGEPVPEISFEEVDSETEQIEEPEEDHFSFSIECD